MIIDLSTLRRLNTIELESYAGKNPKISLEDIGLRERLYQSSIELTLVEPQPEYPSRLRDIVAEYAKRERYEQFIRMREGIMKDLARNLTSPNWNLLTVLLGGIYVGEPEDFRNYLLNSKTSLLYPVVGFGQKVADIDFL